jgi:1,4-dihydroxy-6-naphthoate synthase
MDAVLAGNARGGVIIHEGRFTYAQRGLVKLADLGSWWEESRNLPIPLGCIVIRRSLGEDIAKAVNQGIRNSLERARSNEKQVWGYIKQLAKEMADEVVREHIRTFVTEYSKDVGVDGERAVSAILAEACLVRGGTLPKLPLFVPAD